MQATAETMHAVAAAAWSERHEAPHSSVFSMAPDQGRVTAAPNRCLDCGTGCYGDRCRRCHARHHFSGKRAAAEPLPHCLDCRRPLSTPKAVRCRKCAGKVRRGQRPANTHTASVPR